MSNLPPPIRQALSELLAPLVAMEGGEIYLSDGPDGALTLHWAGRYSGSSAAALVHQELAVPLIEAVAPGTVVRWSSGRLIPAKAERLIVDLTNESSPLSRTDVDPSRPADKEADNPVTGSTA